MKIVVLGSGVIGVTSAWYLAKAGHEVTVIDRQPAAALAAYVAWLGQSPIPRRDEIRHWLVLGTTEIFDMPKRGEDAGFGPDLRIAILVDADSPSRADFEFYAIQCGNLGIHFLRLFFDHAQALEWLSRDRAPRPAA